MKAHASTKAIDLTEGNILRRLLQVSLPLMGTQVMLMAYNLTDMFWLGRVGSDAVASVGTAGMYVWLSVAFLMMGRMGAEIGVSQQIGKKNPEEAQAFSENALMLSMILGLLFAVFAFFFRHPLIAVFGIQEAHVAYDAALYLGIVAVGTPATFLSAAITGVFNGAGVSRVPFLTNGLGLILNMVLTPLLIFTFDFGLVGAAWATVIAQTVVVILNILVVRVLPTRPFPKLRLFRRPNLARLRQIFRWTIPIGAESAAFTILSMFIGRFVAAFGADALAVQRIGIQLESFSWLIAGGFASALTAFTGQNFGGGRWDRINRGTRISLYCMIVWGVITTAIPWLFGRQMFALFVQDEAVIQEGVRLLRIHSICQLFICLEFWAVGLFRGFGKTVPSSVATIVGNSLRVPLSYALSLTALGVAGLWWGIALGACLRAIILVIWYIRYARKLPKGTEGLAVA